MWRKKFNIDNKGNDDFRPGQRIINYANMVKGLKTEKQIEFWLWYITPDEFEEIMNWSPE